VIVNPPIDVIGSLTHYLPRGNGNSSAPVIAIYPGLTIIPKSPIPAPPPQHGRIIRRTASRHLEIPPVDKSGRPHARIMCEIWMQQQYVRCVFRVKVYSPRATQNANRQLDRCMIARLWTRQVTLIPGRHIAVAGQPGVYYEEWNFGTVDYYTRVATACTGPEEFVPNIAGYTITVPNGVVAINFIIDLYQIQQLVLLN
ncbi:16482_t:CDS:2, partial [Funneliformis geosporum]